jgi:hypothetical protein
MAANELTPLTESESWHELRDERGRLYARLDSTRFVLEVRRNHETAYFDLREYLDFLQVLATDMGLE